MSKVIISNPTDNTVKIQISGQLYEVGPNGSTEPLDEKVAQKWLKQHAFLSSSVVSVDEEPKKKDSKEPEGDEGTGEKEVVVEETKPKKRVKKTKE